MDEKSRTEEGAGESRRIEELEAELRRERMRFDVIFQNTTVSIWEYNYAAKRIVQPERSQERHGFDTVIEDVPESLIASGFVHPDSAEEFRAMYDALLDGADHAEGVFRVQAADRGSYWYEHIRYTALRDGAGTPYAAMGISTDVTDEMEGRQAAEHLKELLGSALGIRGALIEFDLTRNILLGVENSLLGHDGTWSGLGFDDYIEAYAKKYVFIADVETVRSRLQRARLLTEHLDGGHEFWLEYRMSHADNLYWIRLSVVFMQGDDGNVRLLLLHTDITEQKQRELELQHKANTDAMTGLLNLRAFTEQATEAIAQYASQPQAFVMIDLDNFKDINDTYGHMAGDRVLRQAGQRFSEQLGKSGGHAICGRLGGDEFAAFFFGSDQEEARAFAERLLAQAEEPVADGIPLSMSIGIATAPQDGKGFDELYLAADRALYHAKRHGKGKLCLHDAIWHEEAGTIMRRQQFFSDTISGGMLGGYLEKGMPLYFVDERMLHWLGYESEEEFYRDIGGLAVNAVHPDDLPRAEASIRQQLRHARRYETEHRMRKKDGSYAWVRNIGEQMEAPGGRKAITAACHDITAEKEHADVIQHLVDDAGGGIGLYRAEEDGRFTLLYASEGIYRIAGRTEEAYWDLCRGDALESVYPTDRDAVRAAIGKAVEEDAAASVSYRVPLQAGGYAWVAGTFSRYGQDQERPVIRTVSMPLPVQHELQLQTLDADAMGVYVIDRRTKELYYANDASFRMHGVAPCDFAGRTCHEVYFGRDAACTACILEAAAESHGKPFPFEQGGRTVSVEVEERRWRGRDIAVVYGRDMTEQAIAQKRQEELLSRIPGGVSLYRIHGGKHETLAFNSMLAEVFGFSGPLDTFDPDAVLAAKVHPDDRPEAQRFFQDCLTRPETGHSCRYRIWNDREQAYAWIETFSNVVREGDDLLVYATYTDITDTNRVQESLRNSRYALNVVIQHGNLGLWSYDLDTKYLLQEYSDHDSYRFTRGVEDIPESYIKRRVVHPEDAEAYRTCYREILDGASSSECSVRVLNKQKSDYIWMHVHLVRQEDLQDGRRRAIGFSIIVDREVRNIRQLEQTKAALQATVHKLTEAQQVLQQNQRMMEARLELERKKQQQTDQNLVLYFVANVTRGTIAECKDAGAIGSLPPADLPAGDFLDGLCKHLAFADDAERIGAMHRRGHLLELYGKGIEQEEFRSLVTMPDGRIIWARHTLQLLRDPYTEDVMLYEYIYDVSNEQIADMLLKLELTSEYEAIGFLIVDKGQFTVLKFGDGSTKPDKTVLPFEEYMRRYAAEEVHPDDRERFLDFYLNRSFATEPFSHSEIIYRTTEGNAVRHHKGTLYLYEGEGKRFCTLTRRDYTAIVRAEEAERLRLEDALAKAEEAGRAKNDFMARMSHDMRTPMNAILGLCALTIDAAEDPAEVRGNMTKMHSASEFLLGLVNDILDMAKIEDRSLNLNLEPYSYNELILHLRTVFLPQCEAKSVALHMEDLGANPRVLCDKTRLNQVFYNIFSNAVKYTPGGGSISYKVDNVRTEGGMLYADYVVRDTGIGMSKEFQEAMFEPFTRESNEYTAELQGSGLGLSITRQLVELMGGTMHIDSEKGKGTAVTVSLGFACLCADDAGEPGCMTEGGMEPTLQGKAVLLAEDHPINAEIMSKLLRKHGATVLHAANGRVAVDAFRSSEPGSIDVVLMDIRMPEMDGLEAAAAIRALDRPDAKAVPIIAISANAYQEDAQKSLDAGMDAHLAKPISFEKLDEVLKRCLASGRGAQGA